MKMSSVQMGWLENLVQEHGFEEVEQALSNIRARERERIAQLTKGVEARELLSMGDGSFGRLMDEAIGKYKGGK